MHMISIVKNNLENPLSNFESNLGDVLIVYFETGAQETIFTKLPTLLQLYHGVSRGN